VAVRANAKAQFNAPPHQIELNQAVLAGCLDFKAHHHACSAFFETQYA